MQMDNIDAITFVPDKIYVKINMIYVHPLGIIHSVVIQWPSQCKSEVMTSHDYTGFNEKVRADRNDHGMTTERVGK